MRTLSDNECRAWCSAHSMAVDADGYPVRAGGGLTTVRAELPRTHNQLTWFARLIEATLQPRHRLLLWVTQCGVWPSSENWHLYYRLRETYGDHRLLDEAPGHLFLEYESADVVSFVEVGLLSGWDMHLVPSFGYGLVFASHDEWVDFALQQAEAADLRTTLEKAQITVVR